MKKYMELPAGYTALSEDEMTYTSGGSAVGGVVTVVGVAVLASSYVWGISQAKDWLSVSSNRKGNLFTVLGRASDALSEDMSKSPSNFLRDTVAAGTEEMPMRSPISMEVSEQKISTVRNMGQERL